MDDSIALLIYIILPILEKNGIDDELRCFRLLNDLKEISVLRSDFCKKNSTENWQNKFFESDKIILDYNHEIGMEKDLILCNNEIEIENEIEKLKRANLPPGLVSSFELTNPIYANLNNIEWDENGENYFRVLAASQIPPQGWSDIIEHMRFRLEMTADEYDNGSLVHFHGSSAISVVDRNSEVDLLIRIPILNTNALSKIIENKKIKQKIIENSNQLKNILDNKIIEKTQFALIKVQDCIAVTRVTITEHINKQKKLYDTRQLSKLNADSELICKIGDRTSEAILKIIDTQKHENSAITVQDNELKLLKESLIINENLIHTSREDVLKTFSELVPNIGYQIEKTTDHYGK